MTTTFHAFPTKTLVLGASLWVLGTTSLLVPTPSHAFPWGAPAGSSATTVYDNNPANWPPTEAQLAQRCSLGRLVGGLVGGGVGYASSRQEGRSWAIPLGALLGSQMGCNLGAGRGPVPW
ncbi:MAG: glycine zipper 2TM domain-containing protein [Cyanobacteriota bacterium]|nr:glycine zipper 2TM domain-containing protein [Cyanobacteriota bacterium]